MAMSAVELETAIREFLPDAHVTIEDLAGDGDHYRAKIVSAAFEGGFRSACLTANRGIFVTWPGWFGKTATIPVTHGKF